jgi:hypothetical protein
MKILRQPPTVENWAIKVYCTGFNHSEEGCGAKLKVYREDLRYNPEGWDGDGSVTFKCMCCGKLTDIGIENYPERHKELKPYKKNWVSE